MNHPRNRPSTDPTYRADQEVHATVQGPAPYLQPDAATHFKRSQTTAQGIVAALSLPTSLPALQTGPMPLPELHRLPRDTSMQYDIGQVDASGRVGSSDIVTDQGWKPHDRLELIPVAGAIVLRSSPDGLFSVDQRSRFIIPAAARHRHAIHPGDRVLLAAASAYNTMIIYPLSALDDMIAHYHSAGLNEE